MGPNGAIQPCHRCPKAPGALIADPVSACLEHTVTLLKILLVQNFHLQHAVYVMKTL